MDLTNYMPQWFKKGSAFWEIFSWRGFTNKMSEKCWCSQYILYYSDILMKNFQVCEDDKVSFFPFLKKNI